MENLSKVIDSLIIQDEEAYLKKVNNARIYFKEKMKRLEGAEKNGINIFLGILDPAEDNAKLSKALKKY